MKHLIAVLVALLLPLQLSWAVAATYCQHEVTVPAASHFGHHSHVHSHTKTATSTATSTAPTSGLTTDATTAPAPDAPPSGGKLVADLDCSFCQAGAAAALPALPALAAAPRPPGAPQAMGDTRLKAPPERTPDRPQWARLA